MPNDNRAHKQYLILNLISHFAPISRKRLIELTDYRPATVSDITKELLESGSIVSVGSYSEGHGRHQELLDINADKLCAIGLSFTGRHVRFVVAQFRGVILKQLKFRIDSKVEPKRYENQIVDQVLSLLREFPEKTFVGIGLCDPLYSPINYTKKSVSDYYTQLCQWLHDGLAPHLQTVTALSVRNYSSVTLPAMAEQQFGAAQGARNFFCVELSNGIGSSIYLNGRAVAGATGVAGELGHTVVDTGGAVCECGKVGCVEHSTAFPALKAEICKELDKGVSSVLSSIYESTGTLTVSDIASALEKGDRLATAKTKRVANLLGVAIANMVNILNPEKIVVYGFMVELGDVFLNTLFTAIHENTLVISDNFSIVISKNMEGILPLGAIAEMFSEYLKANEYKWVYELEDK